MSDFDVGRVLMYSMLALGFLILIVRNRRWLKVFFKKRERQSRKLLTIPQ